jgi:hypothetical protein
MRRRSNWPRSIRKRLRGTGWQQLSQRFPNLLSGKQPIFSHAEPDGHTYWRVRISGFSDLAQAQNFCDRLRTASGGCSVYNF